MKSDMKYKKIITDKLTVKGIVTNDSKIIYCDENNNEVDIPIIDLFSDFIDEEVVVTITDNYEEDLSQQLIDSVGKE